MIAIYSPKNIKIDIFDLLCIRGGCIFSTWVTPEGYCKWEKPCLKGELYCRDHPAITIILRTLQRLRSFYRYNKSDTRRFMDDLGKTDFFDVWRETLPAPFSQDRDTAYRVGDLCLFSLITYHVKSIKHPF